MGIGCLGEVFKVRIFLNPKQVLFNLKSNDSSLVQSLSHLSSIKICN